MEHDWQVLHLLGSEDRYFRLRQTLADQSFLTRVLFRGEPLQVCSVDRDCAFDPICGGYFHREGDQVDLTFYRDREGARSRRRPPCSRRRPRPHHTRRRAGLRHYGVCTRRCTGMRLGVGFDPALHHVEYHTSGEISMHLRLYWSTQELFRMRCRGS